MISVTAQAAARIRDAAAQAGAEDVALRLAAKRGADGSVQFGMGFDLERENDERVETAGVTLLVSSRSTELLAGVVLDFVEIGPGDFRFVFIDATAGDGASCGNTPGGSCRVGMAHHSGAGAWWWAVPTLRALRAQCAGWEQPVRLPSGQTWPPI